MVKSKKILLLDDDETNLMIVKQMLISAGYEVDTAERPDIAIEKVKEESYAIVFTDMVMPRMNGDKLCVEVKAISPKTEVILISGYPMAVSKNIGAFTDAGGKDEMLRKPVTAEKLIEVVKKVIGDAS